VPNRPLRVALLDEGEPNRARWRQALEPAFADACIGDSDSAAMLGGPCDALVVGDSVLQEAGWETVPVLRGAHPDAAVVVVTSRAAAPEASGACPDGAADFVVPGCDVERWLPSVLRQAIEAARLRVELRHAEEERQADETRYRFLFGHCRDAALTFELAPDGTPGRFKEINSAACRLLGYTTERLSQLSPLGICSTDQVATLASALRRLAEADQAFVRSAFLAEGGMTVPVEVRAAACTREGRRLVVMTCSEDAAGTPPTVALEDSPALSRATIEATADGMLVTSKGRKVLRFNRRFADMWDIPESVMEPCNARDIDAFILEKLKDPVAFVARMRSMGRRPTVETYDVLELKDGRVFERYSRPLWVNSEVVGRVLSFRDVSKRNRAEAALRQSAETARALLNASADAAVLIDTQGTILGLNEPFAQQFEGEGRKLAGSSIFSLLAPALADERRARIDEAVRSGAPARFEEHWEGRCLDSLIYPLFDEHSHVDHIALFSRDVTESRRAQEELVDLLRLTQATLATIPSSLLVLDADLNVLMVNRRYLDERGVEPSAIVGRNIAEAFPERLLSQQSLLDRIRAVAANAGQDELLSLRHLSDQGTEICLDIRICGFRPIGEGAQGAACALLVIDDVTHQRALEEHLRQTSKLECIGTLAGGIAHDFNNLLTGIIGYASLAPQCLPQDSPAREDLGKIRVLGDRAAGLTRQLLAFGRRQGMEPVVLNINESISNLCEMFGRIIGEDIELKLDLAPDLGPVQADATQTEQVIMNLVANARDAMASGGLLNIETANVFLDEEYAARHVGLASGPYVVIAVSDVGCGMDEATRERIFEPFFTTKPADKGTGLGLSIVYGIVKQHGGSIRVDSEPGVGSCFRVYLPRLDAAPEDENAIGEPDVQRGAETILVVDDEEAVRSVVTRILEHFGYSVLCATSAKEAMRLFAERGDEVRLLLSDVVMPDMTGPALYEALAAESPSLKALYVSGYSEHVALPDGSSAPGIACLQKPLTLNAVARKVREVLDS